MTYTGNCIIPNLQKGKLRYEATSSLLSHKQRARTEGKAVPLFPHQKSNHCEFC